MANKTNTTQTLHSLEELSKVTQQVIVHIPEAWENSIDRYELAFIKKVARVERMLRREHIRFSFDEDRFVLARYRKGSDYPLLGYLRINAKDFSFGTEEVDFTWSECLSDVVRKVKCWLGGMSFEMLEK